MKIKRYIIYSSLVILTSTLLPTKTEATAISSSGLDDQKSVEVTVYNNNLGLIKDSRDIRLPEGVGELRFMDVASSIIPVTVHVKSLNFPDRFSILEQNYEYDLIEPNKLLDKYVGKKIKLKSWNNFQDRTETVEAILLSNNNGQVYQIGNEIFIGHPGYRILPELPENLTAKPTLRWLYQNKAQKTHSLEVSYLTDNINWSADYVMVLNEDNTSADLSGWVTINNRSGATYKNAKLKLVAGDVTRVTRPRQRRFKTEVMRDYLEADTKSFTEKKFFEYHIYNLQRKTTIKEKQTKQISLLEASGVKATREFIVLGANTYFAREFQGQNKKQPVHVRINFKNSIKNNLGMPLPAGIVRLYKKDHEKSLQFIGENRIEHTPKNAKISLRIGKAFDITATRIQTDYKRITSRLHESEWETIIRNHKDEDVIVGVIDQLPGSWEITETTHPYKKIDAFTIRFNVNVPQDEEVKVRYRVKVGLE